MKQTMRRPIISSALVVAVACHRGPSAAECKAQVDDMMSFLHAMDHSPPQIARLDVTLATRTDVSQFQLGYAPVIYVSPRGLSFKGDTVEPAALADRLAAERAQTEERITLGKFGRSDVIDPLAVIFMIDVAATWGQVVTVAAAATRAGMVHARFVFAKPSPVKPPPPTAIDERFHKLIDDPERGNKATAVANLFSEVIRPCAAETHELFAPRKSDDRAADLIEGIGPALIACGCKADVAQVRNGIWFIAGNPDPIAVVFVTLAADGPELALPAATSRRDVAPKISAGTAHYLAR